MTSTNDGKDVKSNQTSGPKGKSYYIELYRSLDGALSGERGVGGRTSQLCAAWRAVHALSRHSAPPTHRHLRVWLQAHTATTLLQSEWSKLTEGEEHKQLEEAINDFIQECRDAAASRNGVGLDWEDQLVERGEWFKTILANPWGHPVLRVLLDPRGQPPSDEEVLGWLREEQGVMFSARVRQLAGSRCGDLALKLASAVLQRARDHADSAGEEHFLNGPLAKILTEEAGFTADIWDLLVDLEFVLLHKGDKRSRCIELAKRTPLRGAHAHIERLRARGDAGAERRLWRGSRQAATLLAQVSVARCMVVPQCAGEARRALYCCAVALARLLPRPGAALAALAAPAASAAHLHTLAAAVHAQAGAGAFRRAPIVCELYVRAITAGMNELERLKLDGREADARCAERQLAAWLTQLGGLLAASPRLRCECALTAFSVHPAPAMYDCIRDAPPLPPPPAERKEEEPVSEFGSWATDSRSLSNLVKTSETLNLKLTQRRANVLSTAVLGEGERLGLSPELCQDIAVLLSGPRLKTLSWDMEREALLAACRAHAARTCGGTRAAPTPRPLLGEDYAHLPEPPDDDDDFFYGIEKGYEHLVEPLREPEDVWREPEGVEDVDVPDSASDGEGWPARRPPSSAAESDTDPLSMVAEAKKAARRKERPRAKDRSKERKPRTKTKSMPKEIRDPLATDADRQSDAVQVTTEVVKEKKKRERKKKDRPEKTPKPKSDKKSTTGVVVVPPTNLNIPSLNYDTPAQSQGSLSDVHHQVTNSTEDIKSLLCGAPEQLGLAKSSVLVNTPTAVCNKSVKVQPSNSVPIGPSKFGHDTPVVQRHDAVNAKVKNSITKLLQFRREKAMERIRNSAPKTPNAIIKPPQIPLFGQIRPKAVDIPDIPKVVINKQQSDKLSDLKNEVHQILNKQNQSFQQPVIQFAQTNKANPLNDMQASQDKYLTGYASESSIDSSKSALNVPDSSKTNKDTPSQKEFYEFLQELQKSINAGTNRDVIASDCSAAEVPRPLHRPTSVPTNPDTKLSQGAKSIAQQNKSDALNTFSRLSYMHKHNKNDTNRLKQTETAPERPDHTLANHSLPGNIEQRVQGHKYVDTNSYLPTQHSMVMNNTLSNNTTHKVNITMSETVRSHPLVANILQTHAGQKSPSETRPRQTKADQPRDLSMPSTKLTALGENDQNDLLSLLRQQRKQNETRPRSDHVTTKSLPNKSAHHVSLQTRFTELQSILNWNPNKLAPSTSSDSNASHLHANTRLPQRVRGHDKKAQHVPRDTPRPRQTSEKETVSLKSKMLKTDTDSSNKEDLNYKNKTPNKQDEWRNVLDILRSHNTPSRGPKALELTLTNDRIKLTNPSTNKSCTTTASTVTADKRNKTPHHKDGNKIEGHSSNNIPTAKRKEKTRTTKDTKIVPTKSTQSIPSEFDSTGSTLHIPKRSYQNHKDQISVIKTPADTLKRQFTCSLPKTDDPFISGIPNSDYDLLEELMDDDLRQEIGELSDDDSFVSTAQIVKDFTQCNNVKSSVNISPRQDHDRDPFLNTLPMVSRQLEQNIGNTSTFETMHSPATPPALVNISMSKNTPKTNVVVPPSCNNISPLVENEEASAVNSPNTFVAAIPQQADLTNVLVIGSELVYQTCAVQSHPGIESLSPTTIITYNNQPNMAIYQSTQYAAPVVSPCIIANASISTTVNNIETEQMPSSMALGATNTDEYSKPNVDLIPNNNKHNTLEKQPNKYENKVSKLENGMYDLNSNKNIDTEVLSEIHEMFAVTDQTPTKSSKTQKHSNDCNEKIEALRFQERLKNKRLEILNRKIHNKPCCDPIPLPYTPLEDKSENRTDLAKDANESQASKPEEKTEDSVPLCAIDSSKENINTSSHVKTLDMSSKVDTVDNSLKNNKSAVTNSKVKSQTVPKNLDNNIVGNRNSEIISKLRSSSKRRLDKNDSSADIPSKQSEDDSKDRKLQNHKIPNHLDSVNYQENKSGSLKGGMKTRSETIIKETSKQITNTPQKKSCNTQHADKNSPNLNVESKILQTKGEDKTHKESIPSGKEDFRLNKNSAKPSQMAGVVKTNMGNKEENNSELSSIPQAYKDSIVIENVPNKFPTDQYHKCVRIKLPNGRVFKATVKGNVHVNFDTLFSDPKIKNVLLSNISDRRRYTLNIKQIAPVAAHLQPNKSHIQLVKFQTAPEVNTTKELETINLLSDDDEDDSCNFLDTEFGKFKLSSPCKIDLVKHQKRLHQKAFVKLKRNPGLTESDVTEKHKKSQPALVTIVTQKKLVDSTKGVAPYIVPEIIDLGESSEDDAADVNNQSKQQNVDKEPNDSCKNIEGVNKENTIDSCIQDDKTNNKSKDLIPSIETLTSGDSKKTTTLDDAADLTISSFENTSHLTCTSNTQISCRTCYVKLDNCDDLVKYYESMKQNPNSECANNLRCTEILENLNIGELDNSDTVSCRDDDDILEDMFDISKSGSLSRAGSFSILNDFPDFDIDLPSEEIERNSSPVIDVFEAIAALHCKSNNNSNVIENEYESNDRFTCLSEWHDSKQYLRFRYNCDVDLNRQNFNEWLATSGSSNIEEYDDHTKLIFKAPTLSSILTKYFQNRPWVIDLLSEIKNTLPVLKRKSSCASEDGSGNKILKADNVKTSNICTKSLLLCDKSPLNLIEKDIIGANANLTTNCFEEKDTLGSPAVQKLLQHINVDEQLPGANIQSLDFKQSCTAIICSNIIGIETIKYIRQDDKLNADSSIQGCSKSIMYNNIEVKNHDICGEEEKRKVYYNETDNADVQSITGPHEEPILKGTLKYCSEIISHDIEYKNNIDDKVVAESNDPVSTNVLGQTILQENISNSVQMPSDMDVLHNQNENQNINEKNDTISFPTLQLNDIFLENDEKCYEFNSVLIPNSTIIQNNLDYIGNKTDELCSTEEFDNLDGAGEKIKEGSLQSDSKIPNKYLLESVEFCSKLAVNAYSTVCNDEEKSSETSDECSLDQASSINEIDCIPIQIIEKTANNVSNSKDEVLFKESQETINTSTQNIIATKNNCSHDTPICIDSSPQRILEGVESSLHSNSVDGCNYERTEEVDYITTVTSNKQEDSSKSVSNKLQFSYDLKVISIDTETSQHIIDAENNSTVYTGSSTIGDRDVANVNSNEVYPESSVSIPETPSESNKPCIILDQDSDVNNDLADDSSTSPVGLLIPAENAEDQDSDIYKNNNNDADASACNVTLSIERLNSSENVTIDDALNNGNDVVQDDKLKQSVNIFDLEQESRSDFELSKSSSVSFIEPGIPEIDSASRDLSKMEQVKYEVKCLTSYSKIGPVLDHEYACISSSKIDLEKCAVAANTENKPFKEKCDDIFPHISKEVTVDYHTTEIICSPSAVLPEYDISSNKQYCKEDKSCADQIEEVISDGYSSHSNILQNEEMSYCDNNDSSLLSTSDDSSENENHLRGIEYEDPEMGTCYAFPIARNILDTGTENETDSNQDLEEIPQTSDYIDDIELKLIIPKATYSKKAISGMNDNDNIYCDKRNRTQLKRKINANDNTSNPKKYRKSKGIDYPKTTLTAIADATYGKQFKCLIDYISSIKFSYSIPFHKEEIEVQHLLQDWPLKGSCNDIIVNKPEVEDILFKDVEDTYANLHVERLKQLTLAEEIDADHNRIDSPSNEENETNFSMGFGEGSGRVIQNFNVVGDISKYSAATLSDVKQFQPLLLSESMRNTSCNRTNDEKEKICRYVKHLQLREKVKAFFKNTTDELNRGWLSLTKKDPYDIIENDCPFGLNSSELIEPLPSQEMVYVVQVGQLPVSAAAQNPVTCDPRVTQVSDASPSQCSAENSPNDDPQSEIKTEYTELTTADINLPMVQDYEQHNHVTDIESQESPNTTVKEEMPIEAEMKSIVKIELEEETPDDMQDHEENTDTPVTNNNNLNHVDFSFPNQNVTENSAENTHETNSEIEELLNAVEKQSTPEHFPEQRMPNGTPEKTDQIAHAMNAAGITTMAETITSTTRAQALVNILSHKIRQNSVGAIQSTPNTYTKTTSINAMSLQQALAQILPPPLNHTNVNDSNQQTPNNSGPPVLHIVQGKNSSGNQITLVDNSQQSVINNGGTPVLHIVQNKSVGAPTSNGNPGSQTNSFSGLSLVDAGLQQGGNQLLHIVNTGSQKSTHAGQLLKRVNLLTNLPNAQGSNEQKMVQFLCKSADGKSIQLNTPHQRSMVLRLQPVEAPNLQAQAAQAKQLDSRDATSSPNVTNSMPAKDDVTSPQEIKSRSVYEENYAKFIQNSSNKTTVPEKATSLPKFGQAFGKQVFQDGSHKQNDGGSNGTHMSNIISNGESAECQSGDNSLNLDHLSQIGNPPLLLRKSPQTSQAQPNLVQQIKQTMAPMNMTMHGGVIYTRQIPVNIGPGQTINLITVPSTELVDDSGQKTQSEVKFVNQGEMEPSIIKIVPQTQSVPNTEVSGEENGGHMNVTTDNNHPSQPQQVLTQMRIKLPMLSKAPQMVAGARVVRPSFFQIQRNVIGGANQPVYQQLVLTAAPPLGQQTLRLPQAQPPRQVKVPTESQSSPESQMSSSTLEQLREFDLVLEQVKERSTVQPNSSASSSAFSKIHAPSTDTTDSVSAATATATETTQQVLYSIGNSQPLNVAYVSRKSAVATPSTSSYVRSPDSSGIADSSSSSSHVPHAATGDSSASDTPAPAKPSKSSSKSKSRPKASSNPPSTLKLNTVPAKTSTQKPLEDEQTTQRILYILAEYKEQVENSPDKDKPAPRRRTNPPSNPSGSSKRKKSSSGSRRPGARDMSPVHGDDTCRTMGSEDSSCASQGDCTDGCLDAHSPQGSPRKVARKPAPEQDAPAAQPRNVIVADGQAIAVARGAAGKPATAVLMPANYILPVSMVKGGQQIAIVTNRGPKLLTVGGEGGATNTLLLQRLIGPAGLKPVLARPGVRHVRLPAAALHGLHGLHGLQALGVAPPGPAPGLAPAAAPAPPPLASPAPELLDSGSPWAERDCDAKPDRGSSPEGSEAWNLPPSAEAPEAPDYGYEDAVRGDGLDRTVLDTMPDRYSPDMEAQRIFDKMFDVDSKRSYMADSPRCGYDIDASDCSDKAYQVVQRRDGSQRPRLTHVSAAALRHKYAILEHELRLQKSLSEECEDLGVDSPSAAELFPEAELLFASSPAYDHAQEMHHDHTPQPTLLSQSGIPQPDMDDQIATDELLARAELDERGELGLALDDAGAAGAACAAGLRGMRALDHEEFARAHPNTTFHSEPTDGEVQPFTLSGGRGRQLTSTIFQAGRAHGTVLVTGPQATVIAQPGRGAKLGHPGPAPLGALAALGRRARYDSSPERERPEWGDSTSASSRCGASDSDKCCLSPSDDDGRTSADEAAGPGPGPRLGPGPGPGPAPAPPPRLQSVIRQARARHRAEAPPRTYPPQRAAGGKTAARSAAAGPAPGAGAPAGGKTRAGERRLSGRGVVRRACPCCRGEPAPSRAKRPRPRH